MMRRFEFLALLAVVLLLASASTTGAEYWFQSGARASASASNNNGASVEIQTITPQTLTSGAMAFWVGERLSNGAFLQVGYTISNETGNLTTDCTLSGCSGTTFVKAGDAEWFYEYFPPGVNSTFYGSTGPDGSAGLNGTFHTYSFYSLGNTWYFLFDNKTIGSVNVGASDSGPFSPIAVAELANTSGTNTYMKQVIFANLSVYKYDTFLPVQSAYATINYGVGSRTDKPNPYGVEEIGTRTNYFAVGSGLNTSTNNTRLWNLGYKLTVNSKYGNISSRNTYMAYTVQTISAPSVINLTNDSRVVFTGWTGSGPGYYSGSQNRVQLLMTANITETANWQMQYLVTVSSPYGKVSGSGWYGNGTMADYSITNTSFFRNGVQEFRFAGWSNNATGYSNKSLVTGPMNIEALWQYRVELVGINANNQRVNVSRFLVNNQQVNSTPFLYTGRSSLVSGAYYKGVWLAAYTNVTQNSSQTVLVPLPIYNVTITTTGLLGFPVNASVSIKFENGTQASMFSGPNGRIVIPNVPDGFANATVTYLGYQEAKSARNGTPVNAVFLSLLNVAELLVLAAIFAYVAYVSIKREFGGRGKKKPQAKQAPSAAKTSRPEKKELWSP
jgi:hypothetical protein